MLSTPPAFILSQDQTLMFKCLIVGQNNSSLCSSRSYCFKVTASFRNSLFLMILFLEFSRFLHCLVIKVRLLLSLATAFIYYHSFQHLSTLFLIFLSTGFDSFPVDFYYIIPYFSCQRVFLFLCPAFHRLKWKVYFHFEGDKVDFSLSFHRI